MEVGGVTLRKEEPLDAKAVGKLNQSRHTFFGSVARHGMKMTVHVPDSEVLRQFRGAVRQADQRSKC